LKIVTSNATITRGHVIKERYKIENSHFQCNNYKRTCYKRERKLLSKGKEHFLTIILREMKECK